MEVTATFEDLRFIDKISYYLAYLIYKPSNVYFKYISADHVTYVMFITIAVGCIVIGSYSTVAMPKNAIDPKEDTKNPKWDASDRDGSQYIRSSVLDIVEFQMNRVSLKTTLLIPAFAATMLCGMYYAVKNYSIETVLKYFKYHINVGVVPASYYTITYLFEATSRKLRFVTGIPWLGFKRYRITVSQDDDVNSYPVGSIENESEYKTDKELKTIKKHYRKHGVKFLKPVDVKTVNQKSNYVIDGSRILAVIGASIIGYSNYSLSSEGASPPWIFSNLVGINFAVFGIKNTVLSNFKIALVLLCGLFFYDIYFVFKTDIMITVATKLDVPIKILLPRQPHYFIENSSFNSNVWDLLSSKEVKLAQLPLSLLGLGDIVVPGLFISLCLRFDLFKYHEINKKTAFHHLNSFSKPYFYTSLIGYSVGLITTFIVLSIYKVGQPALLYIVPSVLSSVVILGYFRGELNELWKYNEEIPEYKAGEGKVEVEAEAEKDSFSELINKEYFEEDEDLTFDEDDADDDEDEEDEEEFDTNENLVLELVSESNNDDGEQTDLDVFVSRVYLVDSDSDDDTFLIESESDNDIDIIDDDEYSISLNEIEILKNDRKFEPRVSYMD